MIGAAHRVIRIGVVSYLNARPLIEGLDARRDLSLRFEPPARLAELLDAGAVDVALVPVVDVLKRGGVWRIVSDACIGCDGETMTVRVFSRVPPDRVRVLHADVDSHTSVNLARVLWRELFDRDLEVVPLDARTADPSDVVGADAALLIGDKVVDPARGHFGYEVDLGGAWRAHTGLPFVFAAWAAKRARLQVASGQLAPANASEPPRDRLSASLSAARDLGVARAASLAAEFGPRHGWPVELAERYLTRCLRYRLDARMIEGANVFARLMARDGLIPAAAASLEIDSGASAGGALEAESANAHR